MKDKFKQLCSRTRAAFLGGILIIAGSTLAFTQLDEAQEAAKAPSVRLISNDAPIKRDGRFATSFAPVVKKVAPSVVKVFTTTKAKQTGFSQVNPFDDPFFRRFFGDDFGGERSQRGLRIPKQHGLGSGVIVTQDGYILTNNHVVENADEVKVAATDGREFTAKVVGKDPKTDIAVLKIDAKDLPYLQVTDSDKIEVGDLVLAVGNPFGIGQTVTMGMVSATSRGANVGLDYEDFIQTDAAINPGNSGGALVDTEGRLVGINTAILSRTGGNQGIGFAVPINLAKSVMESLVEHGRVIRGFLGVRLQDVSPGLAKEFNLDESTGALIADVTEKSPAEKAGLQTGDVITEFKGKPVRDSRHLKLQVGQTAPGEKVPLKVLRDGKTKSFEVTLKELPQTELASKTDENEARTDESLRGVTVGDIDDAARRQLSLPRDLKGALVMKVDEDSAAYEAGLRQGDVIIEINRKRVQNAEQAVELSDKIKDKTILLRVWGRGGTRFLVVDESQSG
ncbi:MAG: DegQ family serine endoprotease [Verrucomicrobia bacterium]|nr:DegQ family serine endoprotease [Verrucomicrobiota bacterium]